MGVAKASAKKGRPTGDQDIAELLKTMLKAILSNSFLLRQVTGSLWLAFLSEAEAEVTAGALEEGTAYNAAVKEEGKGHKRGSPHVHIAMRVLEEMCKAISAEEHPVLSQNLLAAKRIYVDEPGAGAYDKVAEVFLHMRVKKAVRNKDGESQKAIWTFAISSLAIIPRGGEAGIPLQTVMIEACTVLGMERKHGPPPRSALERQLEFWLSKYD